MASLFYRFPRLTLLVLFLAVAAGLGALATLGRQEDPSLTERFGRVVTFFPGADAERVEALVTDPIEQALLELSEIDEIESVSRGNVSTIQISMREDLSMAEVEQTWVKIQDEVSQVEPTLPSEVIAPNVVRQYMGAATLVVSLRWRAEGEPNMAVLTRLAEDLRDRLRNVAGTEETEIYGAVAEEIRVLIDPEAAAAAGLTPAAIAGLIASADAKAPGGVLTGARSELSVEIAGSLDDLDRVREVVLSSGPEGGVTRVADIAQVEKGFQSPPASEAYVDAARTVMVAAFLQPELQADAWSARAEAVVAEFAAANPGVEVEIVFAQADYVLDRLLGLGTNLLFSALIVFGVLFFMMGWRAALIVGSALPLTVLLVMILINLYDEPLHQMSVTGLVVSLGLLIDNAIVIVDDYLILRRRGMARLEAVEKAVKTLFGPLLASTLTTIFAFAPIALMPGVAGEFISMIGISVIFAVASSFILAMTVIVTFAAWFEDKRPLGENPPFWRDGLRSKPLSALYKGLLSAVITRPALGIVLSLLLPVAGFAAMTTLPLQFFPPTDRDMFQVNLTLPATASMAETRRVTAQASALIEGYEGVDQVAWVLGESAPRVYYNVVGGDEGRPNLATGWVRTDSPAATARILDTFQVDVREAFPQAQFLALPFEQGPPTPAPIELKLYGPDLRTLAALGDELRLVLSETPSVTYTNAQLQLGEPVARLEADETAAAYAGLRLTDIAGRLRGELDGATGGTVLEGVEELPVRVIADNDRRGAIDTITGAPFPAGEAITPAGAVGPLTLQPEIAAITRIDGQRANPIYGYVTPFTLPAPVTADFLERLEAAGFKTPPGYRLDLGGEQESRGDAVGNLFSSVPALVILMAGAVVLAFNSFRYGAVIFIVGILSVGLAMFGVWLFGSPLGFNAIVGAMGLVGLSINGSIVVLSALKNNAQAVAGEDEAIRETVVDATRHILSTTLTTIGGFTPLLLEGDSFWLPFASAVAGGVAGSAVLALVFSPAAFVLLNRWEGRPVTWVDEDEEAADAPGPEGSPEPA